MSAVAAMMAVLLLGVSAPPPPRYLLAVGHNRGLPSEAELRFAERDATNFAAVMTAFGQVAPARSRTLLAPSPAEVEAELDAFIASVRATRQNDAILLFYYSGHADETDLHLGADRWSRRRLERKLAAWPGRLRVAVVDACRSVGDIKSKGFSKVPRFRIDRDGPLGLRGGVTLRSSSWGEASQESEQLQGAVYTHYLLTALRGAADEDADGRVTLEEAYLYAYQQTVRRSAAGPGNVMHPSVQMDLRGAGALVLTETVRRTAMFVLPAEPSALYLLYQQPSGRLLAEVRTASDRTTRVAVAPGDYLVQRRTGAALGTGAAGPARGGAQRVSVAVGSPVRLAADDFTSVPYEVLAAKGGFVQLWGHEVALTGGGLLSHVASVGPRVRLRYALVRGSWAGDISIDYGRFGDEDDFYDRTEQWLGGDVRLTRRRLIGPIHLSLGAAWRVVDQTLTREGSETLEGAGFEGQTRFSGFAAGPTLGTAFEWALSRQWFLRLATGATAFVRQEGDDWVLRPEAHVEAGLGFSL